MNVQLDPDEIILGLDEECYSCQTINHTLEKPAVPRQRYSDTGICSLCNGKKRTLTSAGYVLLKFLKTHYEPAQ